MPGSGSMPDFARAAWGAPAAGAVIGGCGAATLLLARLFGLGPQGAALTALATLLLVTGALHEDGLADVADGFGGGSVRERKLEIMRDSRLGAYGVCALTLALYARIACLAALAGQGAGLAAAALVAAGAASRAAALLPLVSLPPARADGAGAAASRPGQEAFWRAQAVGAMFLLLAAASGCGLRAAAIAAVAALGAAAALTALARRQIGGYTGDVVGAAQQVAEIAVLLALSHL